MIVSVSTRPLSASVRPLETRSTMRKRARATARAPSRR
jgi:hypothetical protein